MRTYADTSFLMRLVAEEPGSTGAVADYRRLGWPRVFYLSLHDLEVTNAIRQRAFHLRRSVPASERVSIARERKAALALLRKFIVRGAFVEIAVDMDMAMTAARALSERHTERLGCRGFDLLHVALALELKCEAFLTSDRVQGELARAEGLAVTLSVEE